MTYTRGARYVLVHFVFDLHIINYFYPRLSLLNREIDVIGGVTSPLSDEAWADAGPQIAVSFLGRWTAGSGAKNGYGLGI